MSKVEKDKALAQVLADIEKGIALVKPDVFDDITSKILSKWGVLYEYY